MVINEIPVKYYLTASQIGSFCINPYVGCPHAYQLYAETTLIDMKYNCIEVYHRESNGEWHVIHSTWSFIHPMDMNFGNTKQIV